nr:unnamed protein product [Spirometra erinaceieuropaei]
MLLFICLLVTEVVGFGDGYADESIGGLVVDPRDRVEREHINAEMDANIVSYGDTGLLFTHFKSEDGRMVLNISCNKSELVLEQKKAPQQVTCNLTYELTVAIALSFEIDYPPVAQSAPAFWLHLKPTSSRLVTIPLNLTILGVRMGVAYLRIWAREAMEQSGSGLYEWHNWNRSDPLLVEAYLSTLVNRSEFGNGGSVMGLPVKVLRPRGSIEVVFRAVVACLVIGITFVMGCELDPRLIWRHLKRPVGPLIGFCCQFGIMPLVPQSHIVSFSSSSSSSSSSSFSSSSSSSDMIKSFAYLLCARDLAHRLLTRSTQLGFGRGFDCSGAVLGRIYLTSSLVVNRSLMTEEAQNNRMNIAFGIAMVVPIKPEFGFGLLTTGCCPGGGGSNVWTLLLHGDLNLSMTMTFISSIAALGMTPLALFAYGRFFLDVQQIKIPYVQIAGQLLYVVIPVIAGMLIKRYLPKTAAHIRRCLQPLSFIFIAVLVGFGTYVNLPIYALIGPYPLLLPTAAALPWIGFLAAGLVACLLRRSRAEILTIAIETGIQNIGIAILVLIYSMPQPEGDIGAVMPLVVALFTPLPLMIAAIVVCIQDGRCVCCKKRLQHTQLTQTTEDEDQVGGPRVKEVSEQHKMTALRT